MTKHISRLSRRVRLGLTALAVGSSLVTLSACDSLLEVDLPAQLSDLALEPPSSAQTQVNSVMGLFECAYSAFSWAEMGYVDVLDPVQSQFIAVALYGLYRTTVRTGECDEPTGFVGNSDEWSEGLWASQAQGMELYERLEDWTAEEVPRREEFQAITALYLAAGLDLLGEYLCEVTVNGGPLMSPTETLTLAEDWIAKAMGDITAAGGDFAMPNGATSSALTLAHGLRARIRWAKDDDAGALADAAMVPDDYVGWVTREQGRTRQNTIFQFTDQGHAKMHGENTWWNPPSRTNPVTGQPWPTPIPFTGYLFLGIMPDGRAVEADQTPVRWAEELRALGDPPTSLGNGAVADTRVTHFHRTLTANTGEVPDKYTSLDQNIPLVNWQEMRLIEAELGTGAEAIAAVNKLRVAAGLPIVTYADPANAAEIRDMILEERRRALFAEGRFWSTKIRNTDLLWFPRATGVSLFSGVDYLGGIRFIMSDAEFDRNPNTTDADRGTLCDADQRPV